MERPLPKRLGAGICLALFLGAAGPAGPTPPPSPAQQSSADPAPLKIRIQGPDGNAIAFNPLARRASNLLWDRPTEALLPPDPGRPLDPYVGKLELRVDHAAPQRNPLEKPRVRWTSGPDKTEWLLQLPASGDYHLQACGLQTGYAACVIDASSRSQEVTLSLGPLQEPSVLELVIRDPAEQVAALGYFVRAYSASGPDGHLVAEWQRIRRSRPGKSLLGERLRPGEDCTVALRLLAGRFLIEVAGADWQDGCIQTRAADLAYPGAVHFEVDTPAGAHIQRTVVLPAQGKLSLRLPESLRGAVQVLHENGSPLVQGPDHAWSGPPGRFRALLEDKSNQPLGPPISITAGQWLVATWHEDQWTLRPKTEQSILDFEDLISTR